MRIDFRIVSHKKQRYPTVGDYFVSKKVLHFRVSRMPDVRYPVLVFLHEIIEFFMCRLAGVKMKDIDRFDKEYEDNRPPKGYASARTMCGCSYREEPGNDPHAPYYLQHQTATKCERLIAEALGVDWDKYDETVEAL